MSTRAIYLDSSAIGKLAAREPGRRPERVPAPTSSTGWTSRINDAVLSFAGTLKPGELRAMLSTGRAIGRLRLPFTWHPLSMNKRRRPTQRPMRRLPPAPDSSGFELVPTTERLPPIPDGTNARAPVPPQVPADPPRVDPAHAQQLVGMIATGSLDPHLSTLVAAIHARHRHLFSTRTRQAAARIDVGDRVRINRSARPLYVQPDWHRRRLVR